MQLKKFSLIVIAALSIGTNVIMMCNWFLRGRASAEIPVEERDRRLEPATPGPYSELSVAEPEVADLQSPETIDLSDVISDDLKQTVAALRKLGLSEPLVRAAIQSIVDQRFEPRWREIARGEATAEFWSASAFKIPQRPETMAAQNQLKQEKAVLMKDALGSSYGSIDEGEAAKNRRIYGNVPAEKIERIKDLVAETQDLASAHQARITDQVLPSDLAYKKVLDDELQARIKEVLTPQEFDEYAVRFSPASNRLRGQLREFNPTEAEFRKLFRLQSEIEAKAGGEGPAVSIRSISQEKLKSSLGTDRYESLMRVLDASSKR